MTNSDPWEHRTFTFMIDSYNQTLGFTACHLSKSHVMKTVIFCTNLSLTLIVVSVITFKAKIVPVMKLSQIIYSKVNVFTAILV